MRAIEHFKIYKAFPLDGEATFVDISRACNVPEVHLKRLLRHAMTQKIFCEPRPGVIAHTAASAALVNDSTLCDFVGMQSEELWPAANSVIDAIEKFGESEESNHTAFNIAFGTPDPFYTKISKDSWRVQRFARAMGAGSGADGYGMEGLCSYNWAEIGKGTIVDVRRSPNG
jgi:6-hydroxytryprostatin B O-methyltransferase